MGVFGDTLSDAEAVELKRLLTKLTARMRGYGTAASAASRTGAPTRRAGRRSLG